VIAGLVWLTILLYQKAFTPVVDVTLRATRSATSCRRRPTSSCAAHRRRGPRGLDRRDGPGATLDLALDPDKVDLIPSNVEAQLLPKTLFGEKYVSLVIPDDASTSASRRATSSRRTAPRRPARPRRRSTTCCRCCRRSSRSS
jgi:hypothetical protein